MEKLEQLGGRVVACSDSEGYIYDETGIDLNLVKQIKEIERGRISEYKKYHREAKYIEKETFGIFHVSSHCLVQQRMNLMGRMQQN